MYQHRLTILGVPRVKKNNQAVVLARSKTGKYYPKKVDTKAYKQWHKDAIPQINLQKPSFEIDFPVNLACRFYMDTTGKVDLSALYEGIQDVLVELNVLTDDNYTIVASHDGSGVFVDRANPRMEIEITSKLDDARITQPETIKFIEKAKREKDNKEEIPF
jgi:Holliday junction resolvase RusA-like endonuclease